MVTTTPPSHGHYTDDVIVTFLDDGRRVRLMNPFGYVDKHGLRWDVPDGAIVDGASIPQPLWSIIGGPFEGKYRDAAIVHDWFCDVRSRAWRAVHRMFFEAMLASDVPLARAKLMYLGVYWGGPRWTQTAVDNTNVILDKYLQASGVGRDRSYHARKPGGTSDSTELSGPASSYRYDFNEKDLRRLVELTTAKDFTLTEFERVVDRQLVEVRYSEL